MVLKRVLLFALIVVCTTVSCFLHFSRPQPCVSARIPSRQRHLDDHHQHGMSCVSSVISAHPTTFPRSNVFWSSRYVGSGEASGDKLVSLPGNRSPRPGTGMADNGLHGHPVAFSRKLLVDNCQAFLNDDEPAVVLKSPAGTGKTSFLDLLQRRFDEEGVECIYFALEPGVKGRHAFFAGKAGLVYDAFSGWSFPRNRRAKNRRVVLLVDDCQNWYGDNNFWYQLLKARKIPANIQMVLAATRNYQAEDSPLDFRTLTNLDSSKLLLSDAEALTLLEHEEIGLEKRMRGFNVLKAEIVSQCGGNVGALRVAMSQLQTEFRFTEATEYDALRFFMSQKILLAYSRCYSVGQHSGIWKKETVAVVQKILSLQAVDMTDLLRTEIRKLHHAGLIRDAGARIEFTSKMALRYIAQTMFPHWAIENPKNAVSLVLAAIQSMSAKGLAATVVKKVRETNMVGLFEAGYQSHFYPALLKCTMAHVSVIPEVQHTCPLTGIHGSTERRIDFIVDGDLNWGIELLIEGSEFKEHLQRFAKGGKYEALRLLDHVLVDFKITSDGLYHGSRRARRDKTLIVCFKENDFSKCTCYNGTDMTLLAKDMPLST
jgi:hypothetical protein